MLLNSLKVTQLIAHAKKFDAVTNYALKLCELLKSKNIQSELIASKGENFIDEISVLRMPLAIKTDVLIYHYSIGSALNNTFLNSSAGTKILCYHNITPEEFFRPYSDGLTSLVREGRRMLKKTASAADRIIADSAFNASELNNMGFKGIKVIPVPVNIRQDLKLLGMNKLPLLEKGRNFLFVGRFAPNKRFDKIINLFAVYHRKINPASRLILAGDMDFLPAYTEELKKMVRNKGLAEAVMFPGKVTEAELFSLYRLCDAFICLSEHEGFCVPVLEAFSAGLPVFAADRAALSETMGEAGVLLFQGEHIRNAELLEYVLNNNKLLNKIKDKQKERYDSLTEELFCDYWIKVLDINSLVKQEK